MLSPVPSCPPAAPAVAQSDLKRLGECVAWASWALAASLKEYQADGALSDRTKESAGHLLANLVMCRLESGIDDFDGTALRCGREALRDWPGREISVETIEALIGETLKLVETIAQTERAGCP